MARRKPKVTRHGATQPEESRARKQLLLRLEQPTIDRLRALAAGRETTVSEVVADLVASHLARCDALP